MLLRVVTLTLTLGLIAGWGTFISSACASNGKSANASDTKADTKTVSEITALINMQAKAWNDGDLSKFLSAYSRSGDVVYVSSSGLHRGFDAIEKRYQTRYGDKKETMGQLELSDLEVSNLGGKHALCIGKFRVVPKTGAPVTGRFTLIFRHTKAGWRITYDHSSA